MAARYSIERAQPLRLLYINPTATGFIHTTVFHLVITLFARACYRWPATLSLVYSRSHGLKSAERVLFLLDVGHDMMCVMAYSKCPFHQATF